MNTKIVNDQLISNKILYLYLSEVNHETLNILKYVRPGCGFVPKFPVFGRVEVNGVNEDPLFTYLKVVGFFLQSI